MILVGIMSALELVTENEISLIKLRFRLILIATWISGFQVLNILNDCTFSFIFHRLSLLTPYLLSQLFL